MATEKTDWMDEMLEPFMEQAKDLDRTLQSWGPGIKEQTRVRLIAVFLQGAFWRGEQEQMAKEWRRQNPPMDPTKTIPCEDCGKPVPDPEGKGLWPICGECGADAVKGMHEVY